ncbi:MAG: CRTAC1 family protein [Acidobacteriaceae bacterium]|nr:CRTAC1 family protein [Acidobacteriaceae bacterium]
MAADFDNDGWPDIYVACDMTPSLLFHNLHNGTFEERGAEAGVAYNYDGALQAGMGIAVADYDGDGLLDIAKTNFSGDLTSLYHNDDGKFFTDVSREAGLKARQLLGWGVAFVDVDDDGWRDLVVANGHVYPEVEGKQLGDTYFQPTVLYQNLGTGKFRDVTGQAGPAFQIARPARGLAVGDLDGDGRPEIVLVNMNATPSLLKNDGPHGHFLNVSLAGTKSNRSAIGARVIVTVGSRKMIDEVMSGGSYYSQNSFTLHFGLGEATRAENIEIRWPSGTIQTTGAVSADQNLRIVETSKQ